MTRGIVMLSTEHYYRSPHRDIIPPSETGGALQALHPLQQKSRGLRLPALSTYYLYLYIYI